MESSESKWVVVKIRVPFWGTLNNRCRNIIGTQKGTVILTTTQMRLGGGLRGQWYRVWPSHSGYFGSWKAAQVQDKVQGQQNPEPQTLKFKLMGGQTSMYKPGPLVDIRSKRRDALTWYTVSFRSVSSRSNLSFGAGSGSGMSLAVLDSGCLGS